MKVLQEFISELAQTSKSDPVCLFRREEYFESRMGEHIKMYDGLRQFQKYISREELGRYHQQYWIICKQIKRFHSHWPTLDEIT